MKKRVAHNKSEKSISVKKLNIIAIGASAGGLEALQNFLSYLPVLPDTTIVVAQHLSPTHKSLLVQLLSNKTKLKVVEAEHGKILVPNKVYITPPGNEISVIEKRINLQKPSQPIGPKPSVDVLFTSLSKQTEFHVVGVILSGTGTDGSAGIKELKKRDAYILVQKPETAKYDGMPASAILTGQIDAVLSPEEMGLAILDHLLHHNSDGEETSEKDRNPGVDTKAGSLAPADQRIQELEQELSATKKHLQAHIEEMESRNAELQSLKAELQRTKKEFHANNKELESSARRVNAEIRLRESEEKYRDLFNYSPLPKWIYNLETFQILDVNLAAKEKYGYSDEEFLSMTIVQLRPREYIPKLIQAHEDIDQKVGLLRFGIHNHITKHGDRMKMDISGQKIRYKNQPCVMVVCNDVTEKEINREIELLEHNLMQDSIMFQSDLTNQLEAYLTGLEKIYVDMKTSVFLVKENKLVNLSSPSLPPKFLKAIDNIPLEPVSGTIGAAALSGKKVIADDIATNPLWKKNKTIARANGIQASWSTPIFDSSRKVIATLTHYYPKAKEPLKNDLTLFERSASLLSIVLENHLKSRALLASNELNNFVNMATNDAIYDWDVENDKFNWGESFTRLFGHNFADKDFTLDTWVNLTHHKDLEKNNKPWMEFWSDPQRNKWTKEFRFLRADGAYASVEEIGHLIRDAHGKPKRMIGVLRDKTAQKEEESRLRLMESVITNTTDSVLITDVDTNSKTGPHIIYVNEAFTKITGYTSEEVIGRSPRLLQGPKTNTNDLKQLGEALRQGNPYEVTLQNYRKNGEVFWFHFSVSPIADDSGKFTHWIAIQRDVTTQKNAEIQKRLIGEISQMFNIGDSIISTLENVLQHLLRFGDFILAEAWLVSADQKQINLAASFPKTPATRRFYKEDGFIKSLKKGQGLAGEVWSQGQTAVWDKIERKKAFLRKKGAGKAGLKSALGLPLIHNKEVVGVLIFATDSTSDQLKFYESFFKELESTLGLELQRKQLEDELNQLFQNSPDILCIIGDDGKFLKVNPAFANLMGYDAQELNTLSIESLMHPDDQKNTENAYLEIVKGQLPGEELVNRYMTKSGKYRWISWSASRLNNEDGFSFAYGRDITERKELQDLLDNANRLARIGGWEVDLINNTVYHSRITREIHEVPEDFQPELDSGINFYREDLRDQVKKYIEDAISHGTPWDFELAIITAKGNERWVRSIGKAELRDGKCVRLYGSFQDIHEKRMAEMRLKNTADNVPGVIYQFLLHADGTSEILNLTKGAFELWGYQAEECMNDVNLVWNQTRAGGDFDHVMETILHSADTMERWRCQYRSRRPDGEILWLEGFGSPQKMQNGSILWDSLLIDISEKKELEVLLERSQLLARIGSWEMLLNENNSDEMYWSSMTREILGVDEKYDPSLSGGFEFYTKQSKIEIQNAVTNLIENGVDFDLELLITTAQNEPRWIRCIGQSERMNNRCIKIFGSFQDIHTRKIAEMDVLKAFEEKNTILESIGDAFFAVDRDFTVSYWNKEAEYFLNTKREDILNKNLWEVFGDANDLEFGRQYRHAMKTGETTTFEAFYPGQKKWFEVSAYPSSLGLSVYFKDVSQRKLIEERVRQSNERFEKVSEATNDAIWDWDIVTNTLFWGKGFNTIFGYNLQGRIPTLKAWTKFIHKDDLKQVMDSLHAVIEDPAKFNWQQEYRYQKASGEYAFVIDRGVAIRDENGKAIRMVGAMMDITQRKTFEESLQKLNERLDIRAKELALSNAELEQFAFVASHDLQEPLRMVTSFLSQLEKKYKPVLDDKGRQYIHFAVDGAKRMRQIILDLLEFSKVGRQELAGEKIDLNDLMGEVISLHRTAIEERDARIHVENLPIVFSQRAPLLQVLQNIVGNALKYTHKDVIPEIFVSASESKQEWTFAIRDNGIGIDAEYFDKIFIIFQRLHAKDEYEGTGMGLAIVKKIVENLGGKIWVESEEGRGSTFFFTILKAEKI